MSDISPFEQIDASAPMVNAQLDNQFFDEPNPNVSFASKNNLSTDDKDPLQNKLVEEEVTPLSMWEEKRAQTLKDRMAKEEETKAEILSKAKEDIAKFYATRAEKIQNAKTQNRNDEKTYLTEMNALMKSGAMWEKVTKFTNLAPKANEKRPVDRMRKLLVQLKNEKVSSTTASTEKKEN